MLNKQLFWYLFVGKPTKPSRLKAPAKEGRNITLTWIPGEHKTRPVTYSQIIYMGMGMSTKRSVNVTGNATKYTVKGLMPYTKYSFQVITCVENKKRTPLCSDPSGLIEEMTRIIGKFTLNTCSLCTFQSRLRRNNLIA